MTVQECETLLVGLSAAITRAEGVVSEAKATAHAAESTASKARDTAEHAKATAQTNETIFRLFMRSQQAQTQKCENHRKRLEDLEAKIERMAESNG